MANKIVRLDNMAAQKVPSLVKSARYYKDGEKAPVENGVIVGVTLFYAVISVTAVILGDVLMSMMDPRISFTTKGR